MNEFLAPTILLVALTISFAIWCLRYPPIALTFPVFYSAASKTASNLYLEMNRVFLSETELLTGYTGATLRQFGYNAIIFAFAMLGLAIVTRWAWILNRGRSFLPDRTMMFFTLVLGLFLLAVQLANVAASPGIPYPGSGASRQVFWNSQIRVPLLRELLGVLVIFVPVIATVAIIRSVAARNKQMLLFAVIGLASYSAFLIISGQKFNGLLLGLGLAAVIAFVVLRSQGVNVRVGRWGITAIGFIAAALAIGAVDFGDRGISQTQGGAAAGILYRAYALQGGVYYTADWRVSAGQEQSGSPILLGDMRETIRALMPAHLAQTYETRGVNLAGSLPGNAILGYGFYGAIPILILYGLLLGLICGLFVHVLTTGNVVGLFIAPYLWLWTISVYSTGSFSAVLDVKFIIFMAILLSSFLVFKRPKRDAEANDISLATS